MNEMQAVVVQICSGREIEENFYNIEQLLSKELVVPPDVIVLPECFASMGGDLSSVAENTKKIRKWMGETAAHYCCWLVGGTVPYVHRDSEKCRAACFVYDRQGHERVRYDKIHLFDAVVDDGQGVYCESDHYLAGNKPVTMPMDDTLRGCLGLSVCYDLRFPELYRGLVMLGANILCVPSAFTRLTGRVHWESLLRARAIENQCFVLASNQTGKHPDNRESWGHSMIISPWGDILKKARVKPIVLSTSLDFLMLYELRNKMPCLDHKRL